MARSRSSLSLRALADRAATSHSALSAYETGRVNPTVETLNRIVRAAGYEAEAGLRPAVDIDERRRGAELLAVLELAAEFPAQRHETTMPIFGAS